MQKILFLLIICILVTWPVSTIFAAQPTGGPPGLEKAIAVKDRHSGALFAVPGVAGVGVGLGEKGEAAIVIFTQKPGVGGLPASLEGVPARVQVSGEFVALARPQSKPANQTPVVTVASPVSGSEYIRGASIHFSGTANDKEDGNLTGSLSWKSDGVLIGSGTDFSKVLPDGTHTITVSVTDSGGKTGSGSVIVYVGWLQERPVPIGVSTGHPAITAGTIGARVKDVSGKVYALSNNHVYANENRATIGNNVLQPGVYDGGRNPTDTIGTLSAFKSIVFSRTANNVIDAAIALSDTSKLGNATPIGGYGTPMATTKPATVGMSVMKYGRTTSLTSGQVYAINATVNVTYSSGTARFVHQIVITPGTFSAGGDSGSLIVGADDKKPVGLLFAGSTSYTIANPIDAVLTYFGVTIDGQ